MGFEEGDCKERDNTYLFFTLWGMTRIEIRDGS